MIKKRLREYLEEIIRSLELIIRNLSLAKIKKLNYPRLKAGDSWFIDNRSRVDPSDVIFPSVTSRGSHGRFDRDA